MSGDASPRRFPRKVRRRAWLGRAFRAASVAIAATLLHLAFAPAPALSAAEPPSSGAAARGAAGPPVELVGRAGVFLAAASAPTALSVPRVGTLLAPSPAVAAIIYDESGIAPPAEASPLRHHAPESWFVDSIVQGIREGLYHSSDRVFTKDSVLDGPRFFAREERFDFTPRGNAYETGEERLDGDRRLFMRTGAEAIRATVQQTDVYYHFIRHVNHVDFQLFIAPGEPGRRSSRLQISDDPREGEDVLTRVDLSIKPTRVVDGSDRIVQLKGWVFDLVEFSVYPLAGDVQLRMPIYERRALSLDLVTELEGPETQGAVYLALQSRF